MVRHDAIRVDKERASRRVFSQAGDEPRGKARIYPEAATIMEAERDKIQAAAAITAGVEPEVLALEVSGRGHNCAQELAGGFGAAEQFVDALGVLFGAVKDEDEFGGAAELEAFAELVADEAGGGSEGFDGVPLFVFGTHDADVDPGLLEVGRHTDFADRREDGEARVFEFAGEHSGDFLTDLAADAFVTMSCDSHMAKARSRWLVAVAPWSDSIAAAVIAFQDYGRRGRGRANFPLPRRRPATIARDAWHRSRG